MSDNKINEKLNVTLANAIVTAQNQRRFHWYIKGDNFFKLHAKFEEYYDRFNEIIDEVAERILMLDGAPLDSLSKALGTAMINEDTQSNSPREMVESSLRDFEHQHGQIKEAIEMAESSGDRGTANLLDSINDQLEKDIWMLKAFLA